MSKKVLIVEDDHSLSELEQQELGRAGYACSTADSLAGAQNLICTNRYDCVLLDVKLGEQNGLDLIRYSQSKKSLNNSTPFVLVSGELSLELVKNVKKEVSLILLKPFKMQDLLNRVDQVINARHHPAKTSKVEPGNLLLVDDDLEYCEALKSLLKESNFSVQVSTNSQAALKRLENQRFDCIILDLNFEQGRDGKWVIDQLRKDKSALNYKTPVILVSGNLESLESNIDNLVQLTLRKPIDSKIMIQFLKDTMARKGTIIPPPTRPSSN